jgi:hypothetical protein
MSDAIKYKAAGPKFACGEDFTNLTVINFTGPGGSRACAYSCNMNLDLDGEPQAYGPFSKPQLRPQDVLGNAGWKSAAENSAIKARYELGKNVLSGLEQKKTDLAKTKAVADPAMTALAKQIALQTAALRKQSFEHIDSNGNPSAANPKNFEKIFWKWYGVAALTPGQAKRATAYLEMSAPTITLRKPVLDQTSYYEDVFGRFPVVQSIFEPGPEYFVSVLPSAATNPRFPTWDQRCFIPHDAFAQQPFGALTAPLHNATGLQINDTVFAVRLDTTDTLSFPFRDSGFDNKVAECSFAAFTGLGGEYHPENERAAKFPNDFLLVYLAFPGRQSPTSVLAHFSSASNASDFPLILSFLAQATADAHARHSSVVTGDPLRAFESWKKAGSKDKPQFLDVIMNGLSNAGNNFVERMMRTHPSLLGPGLLQPPSAP